MYVCICHAITESEIEAAVQSGTKSFAQLARTLGVATTCGICAQQAKCTFDKALRALTITDNSRAQQDSIHPESLAPS